MHSNDSWWGEAAPSLQQALDDRNYAPLPEPGSNDVLDAFVAAKNISHLALARIGARWQAPDKLAYVGPGYIKHRDLVTGRKWNDLEFADFSRLRIARADQIEPATTVLVAEGETDAAWLSAHYPDCDIAITPSGADSIAIEQFPQHAVQLATYPRVVVALDNDEAGRRNATRLCSLLPGALSLTPVDEGADWCTYNHSLSLPVKVSRFMPAREFLTSQLPEVKSYLANSVMPVGGQVVVHGAAKNYKSYLTFDLCARLATGRGWAGFDFTGGAPCRVGIVQYEIRPGYYQDRVKALLESITDADEQQRFLDNFLSLDALAGTHLTVDDKPALQAFYREVDEAALDVVLLDPVRQMMADKDLNSEQDVSLLRAVVNPLKDMGVTVILTHHDNKESAYRGGGNPLGMTGSGAFAGDADSIISIALPGNIGPEFTSQCHHRDMYWMLRNAPSPDPCHFEFVPEDGEHGARFAYGPGRISADTDEGKLIIVTEDNPTGTEVPI
jgi:hypothetical protein